jgi:uncharacterized membrane protein
MDRNRKRRAFERQDSPRPATSLAETRQVRLHRFLFPDGRKRIAKDSGCAIV